MQAAELGEFAASPVEHSYETRAGCQNQQEPKHRLIRTQRPL